MRDLGLFTSNAITELETEQNIECVECIDGTLLENLLFYDSELEIYYMCVEYAKNEWTSCYKVYAGKCIEIYNEWEKLTDLNNSETN